MHDISPGEKLNLDLRSGLPDALQVLLRDYPREGWVKHPGYDGLIRFWLDRHMMFRRILQDLTSHAQNALDGHIERGRFRHQTGQLGSVFVQELHSHHGIEDAHYFPILSTKDTRIAKAFALLDRDHHALDGHLNRFVEDANSALRATDDETAPVGRFHETLLRLNHLLDRHLIDEEEIVVPVILKYGVGGLG